MRMLKLMPVALILGALCGGGIALPSLAQGGKCLTDNEIQSEIQSGQIKSWPKIKALAGIPRSYQEVSDVRVCLQGGVPYYSVNVVSPDGKATKIVVSAIDGSK